MNFLHGEKHGGNDEYALAAPAILDPAGAYLWCQQEYTELSREK